MQRRLIASVVGGIIGLGLASRLQDVLGVSATLTYIAFAVAGIAVACVASMLFDVFAGSAPPGTTSE